MKNKKIGSLICYEYQSYQNIADISLKGEIKSEDGRGMDTGVKSSKSVTASIWAVIIREG